MTGLVSGIKRMEIHDGDGLRTTVFFKGCTLKCIWCHNPESISFEKETARFKDKCRNCGLCHGVVDSHTSELCPMNAIVIYGKEYTPEKLVDEIMQDEAFFKSSGGGVTFSGGECLAQGDFAVECAKKFSEKGISVYIDTCGNVGWEVLEKIIPYTDKFLYDIKAIDSDLHKRLTGDTNELILDNLSRLCGQGCEVEIRYPLVVGYNDGECEMIGDFLNSIGFNGRVKVLQYHNFAGSRYEALGMENTLPDTKTGYTDVENAVSALRLKGIVAINGIDET